jgi:glycosyltransferase involved in cell wall biosynthesis
MTEAVGRPLNVTCFFVRRPHFGEHSGINQFVKHLDPAEVRVTARPVSDNDDDLALRWPWRTASSRTVLRRMVKSVGPGWYKLSDFAAELDTASSWWRRDTDLLHFIDGEHTANLLPWLTRRIRNRGRTVATYHQSPHILPGLVPLSVVSRLDHVTVVAATQRTYFEQALPPARISVILHGIDTAFFHPVPRVPSATVRCLIVGSYLRDWSLLRGIARAFNDESNVAFDVVSSSAPEFDSSAVRVHRQVSDHSLRELYHRADILLLPLSDATANNALLEGMACGLPVIGSDLPSLREYAGPGVGTFVPHEIDAFVESIRKHSRDGNARVREGEAARLRAEALSWKRIAPIYAALYHRIVTAG